MIKLYCIFIVVIVSYWEHGVQGHGMMLNPPSRSSLWRFGYESPQNYNDNELFCGGYAVQWEQNKGLCGECGDDWALPRPRDNEEGGKYGLGIISATYTEGQAVKIDVDLTSSHMGFFEFRLCPKSSADELVQQSCLDKQLLELADGSGTRFPIPTFDVGLYYPVIQLPKGVTCDNCVLQWQYTAGNSWGICENGTQGIGCGAQEMFRNCADVAILPL